MVIPSAITGVPNTNALAPPSSTFACNNLPNASMCALHGVAFVCVTAIVTIALVKSLSFQSTARNIALDAVRFVHLSVPGLSPTNSSERPRDASGAAVHFTVLVRCGFFGRKFAIASLFRIDSLIVEVASEVGEANATLSMLLIT